MKRLFAKIWSLTRALIAVAQKVVLTVSLFWVYYFGLFLTWLLAKVFDREIFKGTQAVDGSYWQEAEGYVPDLESMRRPS